ncbi:MAG: class I SAM-dependent methyltransferase [Hydrotalea sp.]|nr:class I SAM-dependent methyltransferase [Hydrotalea sp.]
MILGFNVWTLWRPFYRFTWGVWQKNSYRHFVKFTKKSRGLTILDLGTGIGPYIKNLGNDNKNKFIFTEPDKVSLAAAERSAKENLPTLFAQRRLQFRVGTAESILKKTEKVDIIVLIHVISVVPNPARVLQLAMTKLKPGGKIMMYLNTRKSKFARCLNIITRPMGFQCINMNKIAPKKYRTEPAGVLNTCYIIEK